MKDNKETVQTANKNQLNDTFSKSFIESMQAEVDREKRAKKGLIDEINVYTQGKRVVISNYR